MIEDRSRLAAWVGMLTIASTLALSASLHFPEVLLDPPSFARSLLSANPVGAVASLALLLAQGIVLALLTRPAGICVAAGAVLALVPGCAQIAFVCVAVAAPVAAAIWTIRVPARGVLGWLAASGLLSTAARSSVWLVNTLLPTDKGLYITSAVLSVTALLAQPLWAGWLLWRNGWLTAILVPAQALLLIVGTPTPLTDDVPKVPSAAGHVRYAVGLALRDRFALPTTHEELLARRRRVAETAPEVPERVTLEKVDASGVPAERICADTASRERVLLNLPGGGFFMPPGNDSRRLAANVSRVAGACVLMLHYRLAPENPFPAAVHDGVRAYRWLRAQGIPASRIGVFGDSAGGNLTVTTALALRDSGDELPAALVSISGIMDFTKSSDTWRTKAPGETLILPSTADYTIGSYAPGDRRDPLVSPLYARLEGLPPTLLMMGSQEVLLGDAMRMADRLREAAVPVRLEVWPGAPHAWTGARVDSMETRLAVRHIARFLSARLS